MRKRANQGLAVAMVVFSMLFMHACSVHEQVDTNTADQQRSTAREPEYRVSHKILYKGNELATEWFYEYDNGLLVKEVWESPNSNPVKGETVYTYDGQGRRIKAVTTTHSDYSKSTFTLFDKQGQATIIDMGSQEGKKTFTEVETIEYEYPEDRTSVLVYIVNPDGTRTLDYEEYHDLWGHVIGNSRYGYSQVVYDRYGAEIGRIRMGTVKDGEFLRTVSDVNTFYDKGNNIKSFTGYSDSDGFTSHQFTYDSQGRITRNIAWHALSLELDQLLISDRQWTYNPDGSYIEETHIYDAIPAEDEAKRYEVLSSTEYSPHHIPTKRIVTDVVSGVILQEIIYDVEGDPERWTVYRDEGPESFVRYEKNRDDHGNVLEAREYSGDVLKDRYVYEYVFQ